MFATPLSAISCLVTLLPLAFASGHADAPSEDQQTPPKVLNTRIGLYSLSGYGREGDLLSMVVRESAATGDINGNGSGNDLLVRALDRNGGGYLPVDLAIPTINAPMAYEFEGASAAFLVDESDQGDGDLNGDGDTQDDVLHLFDAESRSVVNLGLAAAHTHPGDFSLGERLLVISVQESQQGDLNGDGDTMDRVVHIYDRADGSVVNLGVAVGYFNPNSSSLAISGARVAFFVSENFQGSTDLNGDGDKADLVVHHWDEASGTLTDLGIAGMDLHLDGTLLAFLVREGDEGVDLNGNGLVGESVLHVADLGSGSLANLGFPVDSTFNRGRFHVGHGLVVVDVEEEGTAGPQDLNGDGDMFDPVVHVWSRRTGTTTNLGLATSFTSDSGGAPVAIVPGRFAFVVREASQGGTDLNGDGDLFDKVLHVWEARTGAVTNTMRVVPFSRSDPLVGDGRTLVFVASESDENATDLNGDGDALDEVPHALDLVTGNVFGSGLAAADLFGRFGIQVAGPTAAFLVDEMDQGATDLNGDGDVADAVVHLWNPTGSSANTGLATLPPSSQLFLLYPRLLLTPDGLMVGVLEQDQGNQDLDGDGGTTGTVLHLVQPVR